MGTRLCRGGARGERGQRTRVKDSLTLLRLRRKQPSWRGCPFVSVRPSAHCGRGWRYHKLRESSSIDSTRGTNQRSSLP